MATYVGVEWMLLIKKKTFCSGNGHDITGSDHW
jgi:hypothetical protein